MSEASDTLRVVARESASLLEEQRNGNAVAAYDVHSSVILDALATILERLDKIEENLPPDLDGDGFAM